MMQRTQVMLEPSEHRRARRRAAELGISLAEYIRRLVREDLEEPTRQGDMTAIFDLGDSGGSDIATSKDRLIGAAVTASLGRADERR